MSDFSSTHLSDPGAASATSTAESTSSPGFASRLRDATKTVHREAERTGFLADLIRGRGSRSGYALFMRNLVPVYEALETGLANGRKNSLLAGFSRPGLERLPGLRGDVEALAGADWERSLEVLPETRAYADAITRAATMRDGSALAAHAYARYLGDLSGGQILAPLLARSLGLQAEVLRFYAFPGLGDPDVVKQSIRAALDLVPAFGTQADLIISEAVAAFRYNIDLSRAVSLASGAIG